MHDAWVSPVLVLVFMTIVPAYVCALVARKKGFSPAWLCCLPGLLLSWLAVAVVVLIPQSRPEQRDGK